MIWHFSRLAIASMFSFSMIYQFPLGYAGCQKRLYTTIATDSWAVGSFDGFCIKSQQWVLFGGGKNKPLQIRRMTDMRPVFEFEEKVYTVHSVARSDREELLVRLYSSQGRRVLLFCVG